MSTEELLLPLFFVVVAVVYMCLKQFLLLLLLFLYKVICLLPTYELALQTGQMAEKMGKFCPEVKIGYAVRGEVGKKRPPASKFAIIVSKADLPSYVSYYKFVSLQCQEARK